MKISRSCRGWTMVFTISSLFAASLASGADTPIKARSIHDVALQPGGVFRGQILDTQGKPRAKCEVVMLEKGKPVARMVTDADGRFAVLGAPAGVFEIDTRNGGGVYRAWAPGTAPPAAKPGVLIVTDAKVVRAQGEGEDYGPAIRGGIAGALGGAGLYWALDHNPTGS